MTVGSIDSFINCFVIYTIQNADIWQLINTYLWDGWVMDGWMDGWIGRWKGGSIGGYMCTQGIMGMQRREVFLIQPEVMGTGKTKLWLSWSYHLSDIGDNGVPQVQFQLCLGQKQNSY